MARLIQETDSKIDKLDARILTLVGKQNGAILDDIYRGLEFKVSIEQISRRLSHLSISDLVVVEMRDHPKPVRGPTEEAVFTLTPEGVRMSDFTNHKFAIQASIGKADTYRDLLTVLQDAVRETDLKNTHDIFRT